ncbi:MAG TPA: hypothetical protein VLJ13_08650 [Brevundimonas sp.]|nr:hypothetical protein [Brevundimonas sp.]
MLITALMMTAALAGGEPDGVVATAPATPVSLDAASAPETPTVAGAAQAGVPHNLSTDQQIQRWIAPASPSESAAGSDSLIRWDRKPKAEVSVTVGTGGYRDYGAVVTGPIGENGQFSLSYRQVENGYGYPYGIGDPYFDDSGYVFPGRYRPGAAAEYESRVMRPEGPARLRALR